MKVSVIKVFRRMFGLTTDDVTRGWRGLHNEELRNLYSWPGILKQLHQRE